MERRRGWGLVTTTCNNVVPSTISRKEQEIRHDGTKWRGWRADIFSLGESNREKRTGGILIRSWKRREKKKGKKRKGNKGTKYFRSFLEKNQFTWMCLSRNGIPYQNLSIFWERERWHFFADNTAKDGDIPAGRHDDKSRRIILKYPYSIWIFLFHAVRFFAEFMLARPSNPSTRRSSISFPKTSLPSLSILLRFLKIISRGKMFVSHRLLFMESTREMYKTTSIFFFFQ